jgi:5-methylcytosine-specific restriction endonuclease McrA
MTEYRACIRCYQTKLITDFAIDRHKKSGYKTVCLACKRIEKGQTNLDAPRRVLSENPLPRAERYKRWVKNNPEKRRAINKKHDEKLKNKIKHAERQRLYRQKKPQAYQDWVSKNPDKALSRNTKRRLALSSENAFQISKKEVTRLYKSNCFYCGSNKKIQIDHAIPLARGGRHAIGNLLAACEICNKSKHAKTIMEFRQWKVYFEQKDL